MNMLKTMMSSGLNSLHDSFNLLWAKLSPVLLPIILIFIFLSIGLWLATFISDNFATVVKKAKIDDVADKILAPLSKFVGTKISAANLLVVTVKWFLIALVLIAALDLADLGKVITFFNQVVNYLPNVFIAALIIVVGSMLANLAGAIAGFVSKGHFSTTAEVAVNALALIAALSQVVTPIISSLNEFIGQLKLSHTQADVLFIGIIVLVLLASKNLVTKTVENLYKGHNI